MTDRITEGKPDLKEILKRLARSREDQQAWEDLYGRIWPWILAVLYRILRGERELAEDASQEVLVRLFRYARFEELGEERAFKSYVYVVCQNVGRNYVSAILKLRESSLESVGEQPLAPREITLSENPALLSVQTQEMLKGLEEDDRLLMQMIIDGHDLTEVASSLGLSYANVAVRLHRIRRRLRLYMTKEML